jgi:hypothetical protein
MFKMLEDAGFARAEHRSHEVVYERAHKVDPRYKVLVYTSIAIGSTKARDCGADAIRVVALFDSGIGGTIEARKMTRIFRTGSVEAVLERMLERMREAYAKCNDAIKRRVHAA